MHLNKWKQKYPLFRPGETYMMNMREKGIVN